jgi:hypothetical protein
MKTVHYPQHLRIQSPASKPRRHMPADFTSRDSLQRPPVKLNPFTWVVIMAAAFGLAVWFLK